MTDPNRSKRVGAAAPWPKGKPRNQTKPPKEFQSMDEFWDAVSVALDRRNAKTELAEYLKVDRKTLYVWLSGGKNPRQLTVNKIGRWLRRKP